MLAQYHFDVLGVRNDAQGILTLAGPDNSTAVLTEIARRNLSITKSTNDLYEQGRSLVKTSAGEDPNLTMDKFLKLIAKSPNVKRSFIHALAGYSVS